MKTLIIGSAILDTLVEVEHLPIKGIDTMCSNKKYQVGGCGYNVAAAFSYLNIECDLLIPIGRGINSKEISKKLFERGLHSILDLSEGDNGSCICLIEPDGERSFLTIPGIEVNFQKKWLKKVEKRYDQIYLSGYQCLEKSGKYIYEWLKTQNSNIYFAPGPLLNKISDELLQDIFYLKPVLHLNQQELELLTNESELFLGLQKAYEKTSNQIIVTLGKNGAILFEGDTPKIYESIPVEIVNTCGAGDTHIGTILALNTKSIKLKEKMKIANTLAAKVVRIEESQLPLRE